MNIKKSISRSETGQSGLLNRILSTIVLPILLVGVLAAGLFLQTATVQGATSYYGYIAGVEKQATAYTMLGKVNAARQNASVSALKWDATLEKAAITRAKEAAIYFSHTRPTGGAWYTVCTKLNAENLYVGYKASASTANSGWMNSSGHRTNRLNSTYRSYAAAAFQGKDGAVYWVEVFSKSPSENTAYRGVDATKTDLAVKMADGYLSVKGSLTDSAGSSLATNSMRVGGSYFLTLKNWNKQFTYSYTLFSKGFFASANTGIATIDRVTGKIKPVRAGVVKFWARTSTASDKILSFWEVIRPQRVTGFVATPKTHAVSMTWNPIAGANGYEVYRSKTAAGTFTKVATVSASTTSYTHTGLTTDSSYYYKVRAYVVKAGSTTRYPGYCCPPIQVTIR
jgi:uncharacterized protein YkwD